MIRTVLASSAIALLLAGCGGGGDINIAPSTVDNSVNNGGGGTPPGGSNPCASYVDGGGSTIQGTFSAPNCQYPTSFASASNKITTDLVIPELANDGIHFFDGDLIIGESFASDADLAAAGIAQGGDGPSITIEAGVTMAWPNGRSFIVNRGSRIIAQGTAALPITLTSVIDAETGNITDPEAVEQWGGLILNGFGVTNECAYTGTRGVDLALAAECHVLTEGITGAAENRHGGNNDADDSGILEFVLVKHTGGDLGAGNDLNGITFASIGSGTTINNLQTYSTLDDGIEFFGGAVSITNFAGIYNRDDTIDIDAGWIGTLDTVLVIQSETEGNHCIEADGVDDRDSRIPEVPTLITQGLVSAPTIRNMTCVISPSAASSQDEGAGLRLREGILPTIVDSLVVGSWIAPQAANPANNYCLRVEDETLDAITGAGGGTVTLDGIVMACENKVLTISQAQAEGEGVVFHDFVGAADPTSLANTDLIIQQVGSAGEPPLFSLDNGALVVNNATPVVDAVGPFIGVLRPTDTNVFAGWTFGIFDGNRSQPLYFE